MKKLILVLCALAVFSCKKQSLQTTPNSQPTTNTLQVFFYESFNQDSIISSVDLNGTAAKLKYQINATYTVSVKSGDIVKVQTFNYPGNKCLNHITASLLNGGKLEQITPSPSCTNCLWSSMVSYFDTLKTSNILTVKVQ